MYKATIYLGNFEQAKKFVQICGAQPFTIEVSSGDMVIHAKSIIGVLSMDLTQPMELRVRKGDPQAVEAFVERIQPFTTE